MEPYGIHKLLLNVIYKKQHLMKITIKRITNTDFKNEEIMTA